MVMQGTKKWQSLGVISTVNLGVLVTVLAHRVRVAILSLGREVCLICPKQP